MKSDIEQSYIADIISSRYPTSDLPEGIVEVGELTREPAQFSATATKQDGGVGFVQGAAPAPMSSSSVAQVSQPRFGRGGVTAEQSAAAGGLEQPLTALADMGGGIARGVVAQTMGLGGDLESLYNGLTSIFNRPEDQPRIDAFLQGLAQKTNMATTEQISKEGYRIPFTDINMPPLPPVVPAGAPDQKSREASANYGQFFGELAPVPSMIDAGVAGLKYGAKALAPTAANMMEESLRKSGMIMDIVEPSKFNPKTELPKAIEFVASTPETKVYLPLANRAPSVALRLAKPEIKGTGKKDALTVQDIGIVLEKSQLNLNNGIPLDPTNPKDLVKMVDSATAEAQYQLSQPISGANWYEDDVAKAFVLGSKVVPQLATDEPLRVMATVFAASTSYNKRAGENWSVAMRITEDLMKTGRVASRNPENGKLWGGTTGPIMEQQLKFHQFMIDKMGMDKYAEWLLTPHSVKEISNMRAESGLYKSPKIDGKANDMKMGSFAIGEKGGAFFLNLNGIKETTADKWFSRTFNRQSGNLTTGAVSEQGLVDAPRNESERAIMKTWNRAVAENLKLDEQANQAVLWYYEQSLYYSMGIKSAKSESFSDGAKNLLNSRGIPFSESELTGVRSKGNALKASEEQRSAAANGDTTSLGNSDAVKPATEKAKRVIKRSQSAPLKGAE
jgi:hypothetical protein